MPPLRPRQVSNHLELVKADPKRDSDPQDLAWKRQQAAWMLGPALLDDLGGPDVDSRWLALNNTTHCGKLAVLCRLLADWHAACDKARSGGGGATSSRALPRVATPQAHVPRAGLPPRATTPAALVAAQRCG